MLTFDIKHNQLECDDPDLSEYDRYFSNKYPDINTPVCSRSQCEELELNWDNSFNDSYGYIAHQRNNIKAKHTVDHYDPYIVTEYEYIDDYEQEDAQLVIQSQQNKNNNPHRTVYKTIFNEDSLNSVCDGSNSIPSPVPCRSRDTPEFGNSFIHQELEVEKILK